MRFTLQAVGSNFRTLFKGKRSAQAAALSNRLKEPDSSSAIRRNCWSIFAGHVESIIMVKMTITEADEWAIHKRASEVVFAYANNMGMTVHYNNKLNKHEQTAEYAESLAAELMVARYFGLDFDINASKGKREADVGQGIEVRWTSYVHGNLIVYPNDRDNDVAVLVVGKSPTYFIAGWLPMSFCKRKRFKNPRQDSWWIDQGNLNPIENLARSEYATAAI